MGQWSRSDRPTDNLTPRALDIFSNENNVAEVSPLSMCLIPVGLNEVSSDSLR